MLSYRLEANFNVKIKQLKISGVISGLKAFTEYSFLLYAHSMNLHFLSKNRSLTYSKETYNGTLPIPECTRVKVITDKETTIHVEYELCLDDSINPLNQVKDACIELGIYCPWYPLIETLDKAAFCIDISGLDGYTVLHAKKLECHHIILYPSQQDAYIIAMREPKSIMTKMDTMRITWMANTMKCLDLATKLNNHVGNIYTHFVSFYGLENNGNESLSDNDFSDIKDMTFVLFDRKEGGGYCRDHLIVSSLRDRNECQWIQFVAHEIAHLWWNRADASTWHDWLNEGLAEYSAWNYIGKCSSYDLKKDIVSKYTEVIRKCPPLNANHLDDSNKYNSRFKGAYLIYKIEKKYGIKILKDTLKTLLSLEKYDTNEWILSLRQQGYESVAKDILIGIS